MSTTTFFSKQNTLSFLSLFFLPFLLLGQEELDHTERLLRDLDKAASIDRNLQYVLPLRYNLFGETGCVTTPSAKMGEEGMLVFSAGYAPFPIYANAVQVLQRLEIRGNYLESGSSFKESREFFSIKWALLQKEDYLAYLPEIAIGKSALLGSSIYDFWYVVGTKEFVKQRIELSVGTRFGKKGGYFGALSWYPFKEGLFSPLRLEGEYDPTFHNLRGELKKDPSNAYNFSASYSWKNLLQARFFVRGKQELGGQLALACNLGKEKGFFPKIKDPPFYGKKGEKPPLRLADEELKKTLLKAFQEQGLDLFYLARKKDHLWLRVVNGTYRNEKVVQERIQHILALQAPKNIAKSSVILESGGISLHEYTFSKTILDRYRKGEITDKEIRTITARKEVGNLPLKGEAHLLFSRKKPLIIYALRPSFSPYFARGETIRFDAGLEGSLDGYLFDSFYYSLSASYFLRAAKKTSAIDPENPSQIIQVRSDSSLYRRSRSLHLEQAFLQKNWNLSRGFFTKISAGYFELAYGGLAVEALFYPAQSRFAVGIESSTLWKRSYHGLGLETTIRKLEGEKVTFVPYVGVQYFLNLYYELPYDLLRISCHIGRFLAKDYGVRITAGKTFSSGWDLSFWMTYTDAKDFVDGKRYFDKGFSFSLPLDLFLNYSSRKKIQQSIPVRVRDVGAKAYTGASLYSTIYEGRFFRG